MLGRTSPIRHRVNVATTSTPLLGYNQNRKALYFPAPPTNRYTVSQEPTTAVDDGMTLHPDTNGLLLSAKDIGDGIVNPWSAISDTGAQNVTVIEYVAAP